MLAMGTVLEGRYEIRGRLGQGGMGVVYQAADNRLGHMHVAVKEMDASQVAPGDRRWTIDAFRQEAQMLARLNHPGIARVMDYFSQGDYSYLVMEYVEGETLEAALARAPRGFDERQALTWAGELAVVLDYLHRQNPPVIFRDLKPGNVMVQPDGTLKLIDFGIARLFKPGQTQDTLLLGTPGYAAPEQYGRGQTDVRSDVYALAVVVHQLLTGYDPTLTPMRLPPLRQLRPELSTQKEAALAQALQLDPMLRFGSTVAFARALGAPVSAPLAAESLATVVPFPVSGGGMRQPPGEEPASRMPGWAKVLIAALALLVLLLLGWQFLFPLIQGTDGSTSGAMTPEVTMVTEVVTPTPEGEGVSEVSPGSADDETVTPPPPKTSTPETQDLQATINALETAAAGDEIVRSQTATAEYMNIQSTSRAHSATLAAATPIPTLTAAPTVCSRSPLAQFADEYSRDRLGCPTNGGNGNVWMAMQTFDGGVMFWREDSDDIYALFNSGGWARFDDVWREGDAEFTCGGPDSPPTPKRGFGRIWCDHNSVRNGLGNARDAEWGQAGATQDFERGSIVVAPNGRTYTLFGDNGTWR